MKTLSLSLSVSFVTLIAVRAGATESEPSPQQDVLALHRLELRPYGGWAVVPNSETGAFVGANVALRLSRFFALGGDVAWYAPLERSVGDHPSYPLNETLWSGELDAYYVPWPARARSSEAAGAFEPYLVGGVGLVESRPVPTLDATNRHFDYNAHAALCLGAGVRVFVGERVAISLELRDLMYFETIENNRVAPLAPGVGYSPDAHFTTAIQLRLGVGFFILGG